MENKDAQQGSWQQWQGQQQQQCREQVEQLLSTTNGVQGMLMQVESLLRHNMINGKPRCFKHSLLL
jgi:hypothetical protein